MPPVRTETTQGLAVGALAGSLGAGLISVAIGSPDREVDDVTLAEPGVGIYGQAGDLLLGVGVDSVPAALALLAAAARTNSGGVVLRRAVARRREVRAAARRIAPTLVELSDLASWAHVVWLLQGLLERVATGVDHAGRLEGRDELFSIADACADLLDAPVTIEDTRSRVLAHSTRQQVGDPIRLTTIVGRRVPESVLTSLRGRGVFRRLARSGEPFFVPADGDLRARFVVPVRAGSEWLGSIWAVMDQPPSPDVVADITRTASTVALHLLRLRSHDDITRRLAADRLRSLVLGTGLTAAAAEWLPDPPWRVVILDELGALPRPGEREDAVTRLGLWDAAMRRARWRQPQLTDVEDLVVTLVRQGEGPDEPGSLGWLRRLIGTVTEPDAVSAQQRGLTGATGSAGSVVTEIGELAASLSQAREVRRTRDPQQGPGRLRTLEEAWAPVTLERALAALRPGPSLGPAATLAAHDREHGSDHVHTLRVWLDHPGDPRAASARLHVHPNTLRYRIARITEVIDVDLTDHEQRLALRLQLGALDSPPTGR